MPPLNAVPSTPSKPLEPSSSSVQAADSNAPSRNGTFPQRCQSSEEVKKANFVMKFAGARTPAAAEKFSLPPQRSERSKALSIDSRGDRVVDAVATQPNNNPLGSMSTVRTCEGSGYAAETGDPAAFQQGQKSAAAARGTAGDVHAESGRASTSFGEGACRRPEEQRKVPHHSQRVLRGAGAGVRAESDDAHFSFDAPPILSLDSMIYGGRQLGEPSQPNVVANGFKNDSERFKGSTHATNMSRATHGCPSTVRSTEPADAVNPASQMPTFDEKSVAVVHCRPEGFDRTDHGCRFPRREQEAFSQQHGAKQSEQAAVAAEGLSQVAQASLPEDFLPVGEHVTVVQPTSVLNGLYGQVLGYDHVTKNYTVVFSTEPPPNARDAANPHARDMQLGDDLMGNGFRATGRCGGPDTKLPLGPLPGLEDVDTSLGAARALVEERFPSDRAGSASAQLVNHSAVMLGEDAYGEKETTSAHSGAVSDFRFTGAVVHAGETYVSGEMAASSPIRVKSNASTETYVLDQMVVHAGAAGKKRARLVNKPLEKRNKMDAHGNPMDSPGVPGTSSDTANPDLPDTYADMSQRNLPDTAIDTATSAQNGDTLPKPAEADADESAAPTPPREGPKDLPALPEIPRNRTTYKKHNKGLMKALNIEDPSMYMHRLHMAGALRVDLGAETSMSSSKPPANNIQPPPASAVPLPSFK